MRSKTILISLFLLSVSALGAILWRNANLAPTTVPIAGVQAPQANAIILGSAQPLRTGTLLRAEDVKWIDWNDAVPAGAVLRPSFQGQPVPPDADQQAMSSVYGAVLKQRIDPGTPILSNMIVKPGDRGFLAAVLAPGHRAVSIGVNPVSGASGLIFPGDHVDLILTQDFQKTEEPISRRSVSETIVTNIRVLAIDQRLQETSPDPKAQIPIPRTVTIEVLPKQAEMINVAVQLGSLSLALRSVPLDAEPVTANDPPVKEAVESTWADDVSPALKPPKQPTLVRPTTVMHGGKTENVTN
jgi:pilus assembly protein CpaB